MSVRRAERLHSVSEYLSLERASEDRHEYFDGQVYSMAGESLEHGIICVNLTRIVSAQLMNSPCLALSKDMKVRSGPIGQTARCSKGLFSYPDLVVVCGEPEFHDQFRDVLLNPRAIIEVLSPSTEAYDRGQKFLRYRVWLASLTDYLLVSQDQPLIEPFRRVSDDDWIICQPVSDMSDSVEIASIGCTLRLTKYTTALLFRLLFKPRASAAGRKEVRRSALARSSRN